jgi:beta-glucanase (GH16 family)
MNVKTVFLFFLVGFSLAAYAQQDSLVWSDEFYGSGAPDPTKWGYDIGASGWGNNEVQNYTNSTLNSRQEEGVLIIEALKSYTGWTSARLLTHNKFDFTYGRVVFRAKLPVGSGTWPALWMLGSNIYSSGWPACGEMDVMEHVGKDQNVVHCAVHTPSSHGNTVNTKSKYIDNVSTEFHEYQVSWSPEKLEFSFDSILIYTYNPPVKNNSTWPFDKSCFIIMNIAMGGNWGSDPQYETGGKKNGIDPALTSARMEIDYVRVYQTPGMSIGGPADGQNINGSEKPVFYPNPTYGQLQISLPAGTSALGNIYDLGGRNVLQFHASDDIKDIDISSLTKGLYCVTLQSEGKISTQKIILQ